MDLGFESDDDLPLGKMCNIADMIIVAASVLEKNGIYYSKFFLNECAYQLCNNTKKLMLQKELTLIKHVYQKNVYFFIIGILKMLDLNLNHMFLTNVKIY